MKNPFKKSKSESPVSLDAVDTVNLNVLRPVPFPMGPPPERGVALRTVEQLASALTEAGAVDAGNAETLDAEIDAWHDRWVALTHIQYADRVAAAQIILGRAQGRLAAAGLGHAAVVQELGMARRATEIAATRLGVPDLGTTDFEFDISPAVAQMALWNKSPQREIEPGPSSDTEVQNSSEIDPVDSNSSQQNGETHE